MDTHAQTHAAPDTAFYHIAQTRKTRPVCVCVCVCVCVRAHLMDPLFIIQKLVRIIQNMCLSIMFCQMAS